MENKDRNYEDKRYPTGQSYLLYTTLPLCTSKNVLRKNHSHAFIFSGLFHSTDATSE